MAKFIFLGSSEFSKIVLAELEKAGHSPIQSIASAKEELPRLEADYYVVASFGKIIPKEILDIPKHGSINVHPSLLPELRGPSPIQNLILGQSHPGVTIMRMDEKMDHGPILAQERVEITPFPDHYEVVERKLAEAGGRLLIGVLESMPKAVPQDDSKATYTKIIAKEDGLLNLEDDPESNLRKVLAYSRWPGAYINFKRKHGDEVRVVIKNARIKDGKFTPTQVIPAGKKEMDWESFLRGNS